MYLRVAIVTEGGVRRRTATVQEHVGMIEKSSSDSKKSLQIKTVMAATAAAAAAAAAKLDHYSFDWLT